jgi:hypothetical protein
MQSYNNLDILRETEATKPPTSPQGAISGVKVRKSDGLLYDLSSPNVMWPVPVLKATKRCSPDVLAIGLSTLL